MIPFAAETPNAFQWARQPQKLPINMGDLDPISRMIPWAQRSQAPNPISIS